jgi:antirestriction protein ArdC
MPWHHTGAATSRPANAVTGRRYRGINTVALWAAAESAGYPQGLWATYAQWHAAGVQVRKGERATTVVLWKELTGAQESEPDPDREEHRRVVARAFSVFNSAQVSGFVPPPTPVLPESERLAQAEAFIAHLGIPTAFGGSQACYELATDTVVLPPFARFRDAASFYATWLHECGHATGAKHRLNRDLAGRFGSAAYALEEIVVEIVSGFVLADLGIAHQPRPDHAAYIASGSRS